MSRGTRRYGEVIGFRPDMASGGALRSAVPPRAGLPARSARPVPEMVAAYAGGNGGASDLGAHTTHRPRPSLNHEIRSEDADRRQRTPR